jgi:hypothetical protein
MSGAAAVWGLGMEWAAKQAADKINLEGGVTVAGKKYKYEIDTCYSDEEYKNILSIAPKRKSLPVFVNNRKGRSDTIHNTLSKKKSNSKEVK